MVACHRWGRIITEWSGCAIGADQRLLLVNAMSNVVNHDRRQVDNEQSADFHQQGPAIGIN